MKPLKLTLHDYRTFADVEVPLDSIEAASITGPNGAGKSSLIEAMIWALYGEDRSSTVDGVVRLGADECAVALDYQHNGSTYRVIRKRSRGKKSDLQYLMSNGTGEWQPLSGASIRETQDKINCDLMMDRALFLNSSCVMQGQSAGICEAGPAERKAVLYQIFEDRLSKFPALCADVKAKAKVAEANIGVERSRIETAEARVADKPEVEEQ